MPMYAKVTGMDDLIKKMQKLPQKAAKIAAEALYEGAGVVADAVTKETKGIKTKPFIKATGGYKRKASPEEKEILVNANHGISKFRYDGNSINTSIGFQNSGYAELGGKTVPVPLIANSINSGTSFMEKQPFLRKAFSQSKSKALKTIESGIKAHENEFNLD